MNYKKIILLVLSAAFLNSAMGIESFFKTQIDEFTANPEADVKRKCDPIIFQNNIYEVIQSLRSVINKKINGIFVDNYKEKSIKQKSELVIKFIKLKLYVEYEIDNQSYFDNSDFIEAVQTIVERFDSNSDKLRRKFKMQNFYLNDSYSIYPSISPTGCN